MNLFIGTGRNTKEGELRSTESGLSVYRNTMAIKNNFKNKDGNYDTEFINYVAYKNTAEYLHKYSTKGSLVQLVGRIHNGSYEKDGEKKYYTELIVENGSTYNTSKEDKPDEDVPDVKTEYEDTIVLTDEDLPF